MERKLALAIALALTVITTFSVITVGARTGVFGSGSTADTQPDASVEMAPATAPTAAQPEIVPARDPIVITEYVYIDEPAPSAPQQQASAASSDGPAAPEGVARQPIAAGSDAAPTPAVSTDPTQASDPASSPAQNHEDDEDDDEHEDNDDHEVREDDERVDEDYD